MALFGNGKIEKRLKALEADNRDLSNVVTRANARLDDYGPVLVQQLGDEVVGHDAGRWVSVTKTAFYNVTVYNEPGRSRVELSATQHEGVPTLPVRMKPSNGSDFSVGDLQVIEDWTEWARTGQPVNHDRHAERKSVLDSLLSA